MLFIAKVVDGTDDAVLWNVRSECEEDEGTNWRWRQWPWLVKL